METTIKGVGFRVWGLGFRVWGFGLVVKAYNVNGSRIPIL